MAKEIRHFGIVVKDLQESLRFYQDGLGFEIVRQADEFGPYLETVLGLRQASVTTVKMCLPGHATLIELIEFHHPEAQERDLRMNECGPTHLSLTVDDVEAEYAKLREYGTAFVSEPQTSPDGYARVAFCRAPEGALIELVEILGNKT